MIDRRRKEPNKVSTCSTWFDQRVYEIVQEPSQEMSAKPAHPVFGVSIDDGNNFALANSTLVSVQ